MTEPLETMYFESMILNLEQASQAVLSLPIKERAALAHALIHSLDDKVDANIEEAWDQEIEKRLERVERGATTERDAFEVLDEIKLKYGKAD